MSVGQRFLMGMISGAGTVVLKTALNIVLIPVMFAQLGMDGFGLFVLLIGIVEIATLLDLGLTDAFVKLLGDASAKVMAGSTDAGDIAEAERRERALLKVGHLLFAGLGLLFLAVGMLMWPWLPGMFHVPAALLPVAKFTLILILLEGALTLYSSYYRSVLLSHCLHQWANIADSLYHVSSNLAGVLLLLAGYDLTSVIAVRLIAAVMRTLLMFAQTVKVSRHAVFTTDAFCKATFREMVTLGAHGMMINFSIIVSHKIDVFVIALFMPISAVGVYEIVFRFLGITQQVAMKLNEGSWAMFTRLLSLGQKDEARRLFLRMSCFLNLMVGLMLVVILSFYPELFKIFSAGKIPMEKTILLLIIVTPIMWSGVLQMPASAYLFMAGRQKFLTVSSTCAAVANLTLSVLFIQAWGLVGVAVGTLIPQVLQHQGSLIREACKDLNISLPQYVTSVHLNNLIPLAVSLGWLWACKPLVVFLPVTPLLPMAIIGLSTGALGLGLWFALTGTAQEKQLFTDKILQPLKNRLQAKPEAVHGT